MTKKLLCFGLFFFGYLLNLLAQDPCNSGRFAEQVFANYTLTSNLNYGQNLNWANSNTSLKLDFYEPTNDTLAARPLIIWVHGGSFIGGSKTDPDVKTLSENFAKKGYVCASIDYRLGFFPFDSTNAVKAVVRAVQDLRAAIRYFYKDAQTTNQFKIDTNHIFIGGSSAGAITALHVAYLTDECQFSDYMSTGTLNGMGGLEGNSGNPGYSTTVHAVINGCGALARYNWLENGDIPLCSVHGTNDGTVTYNRGLVNPGTPLMYLDGSRMLHERACAVGVQNQFYTFNNAPHVPYLSNAAYMDSTEKFVRDFLIDVMGCTQTMLLPANAMQEQALLYPTTYCDGTPSDESCTSAALDEYAEVQSLQCYPNPTSGSFTVQTTHGFKSLRIMNLSGSVVFESPQHEVPIFELSLNQQGSGVYLIEVEFNTGQVLHMKLILEK
jgi:para-nitrobenzyl esterase